MTDGTLWHTSPYDTTFRPPLFERSRMSVAAAAPIEPQATTSQAQRWLFGVAMMGVTMPGQVFGVSLLFFYTDVKHLPPAWAALALTIYAFYNAVNNPLIGYWQDRTRFRLGRRIPWLRYGAFPFVIMFAGLWLAPFDGATQPYALLAYFVFIIVIYDAINSAVGNAYYALLPEMFVNYRERTDVAAKMMIFLTVALLLGVALPPGLPVAGTGHRLQRHCIWFPSGGVSQSPRNHTTAGRRRKRFSWRWYRAPNICAAARRQGAWQWLRAETP